MIGEADEPSFRTVRGSGKGQSHEAASGTLSHRSWGFRELSTLVRDRIHTTGLRLLGRSSGSRVVNRRHGTNSHPARPTGRLGVLLSWDEWNQRLRQRFSTRTYIAISVALVVVVSPFVFLASALGAIAVLVGVFALGLVVGSLRALGLLLVVVSELPAHYSALCASLSAGRAAYRHRFSEVSRYQRHARDCNE